MLKRGLLAAGRRIADSGTPSTDASLLPGNYEVKIAKEGFQTFAQSSVLVTINSVARVDATLQIGVLAESITLSNRASSLQTDRAEVRAEIGSRTFRSAVNPVARTGVDPLVGEQCLLPVAARPPVLYELQYPRKEVFMPHYVFLCQACKKEFNLMMHMDELDKGGIKCPHCGSEQVAQQMAAFSAVTSKKS